LSLQEETGPRGTIQLVAQINSMKINYKLRLAKKWWFRSIREYNLFSFRYWWMNYIIWALLICSLSWLIINAWSSPNSCNEQKEINRLLRSIDRELENCCECSDMVAKTDNEDDSIHHAPEKNCRVHFSGLLMGGTADAGSFSKIYVEDYGSEYVGSGFYPNNSVAFPKADKQSFDGIAIDKGTRVIIYKEQNFKGSVLLDVEGPLIINNVLFKDNFIYNHCNTDVYPVELESVFPKSARIWSNSNMRDWSFGSCKIICSKEE